MLWVAYRFQGKTSSVQVETGPLKLTLEVRLLSTAALQDGQSWFTVPKRTLKMQVTERSPEYQIAKELMDKKQAEILANPDHVARTYSADYKKKSSSSDAAP